MRKLLALGLVASTTTLALPAWADPLRVVTSFSILSDMVEQIGGEHVEVTSLVGPDSDTHVFSPSPSDARRIAEADLVVFNGLQLEGWMERLVDASSYQGTLVIASDGIAPLHSDEDDHDHEDHAHEHDEHEHEHEHDDHDHDHDHDHDEHEHGSEAHDHEHASAHAGHDHGDTDPHAWLDVGRGQQYVINIRDGLIEADPDNTEAYRQGAADYLEELSALDSQIHDLIETIPAEHRVVVTGHDAFSYFADAYGLRFLSPVGLNTASEPSAALMGRLVDTMKANQVQALFHENITNPAVINQLAEEAGLPIAGTLYSGALTSNGEASTYAGMMHHNATLIHDALTGNEADHAHDHEH